MYAQINRMFYLGVLHSLPYLISCFIQMYMYVLRTCIPYFKEYLTYVRHSPVNKGRFCSKCRQFNYYYLDDEALVLDCATLSSEHGENDSERCLRVDQPIHKYHPATEIATSLTRSKSFSLSASRPTSSQGRR